MTRPLVFDRFLIGLLTTVFFVPTAICQITTSFPGGCPVITTEALNDNCESTFTPDFIEQTFSSGSGGTLEFSYTGAMPGDMFSGANTVANSVMKVRELDINGTTIDSLFCAIEITYLDVTGPEIICPQNITLTGNCQSVLNLEPVIIEGCNDTYTYIFDVNYPLNSGFNNEFGIPGPVSGKTFPIGTSTITYHFINDASANPPNISSCVVEVTIQGPAQSPVIINCPNDVTRKRRPIEL